jgi:glycosyltransferase involved in cell wall biosynthesis
MLHRLWRLLPAGPRRRLLGRVTRVLAPVPDLVASSRPGMVVVGELSRASGLGEAARWSAAGLRHLGAKVWEVDLPPFAGVTRRDWAVKIPEGVPLLMHINAPALPAALWRLGRAALRGRRVIGAWAWELPVLPPGWAEATRFVHEIWAPSRFTATAFEALLPGRVRVVTPPLAIAPPRPSALGRAAFGLPEQAVIVLVSFDLASSFERKNPLASVAAFRTAFGDRADRLLVLKVGNASHFPDDFQRLREAVADAKNIRLETRVFPPADSHALTACADILLSLHRAEGFGLVLAEAMLLGRAVIASAWSGNMDFMDADSVALVRCRMVPAVDPRGVYGVPGAVWAQPSLGAAVAALRALADDASARQALGARGRARAMARLGPENLAAAFSAIGPA